MNSLLQIEIHLDVVTYDNICVFNMLGQHIERLSCSFESKTGGSET